MALCHDACSRGRQELFHEARVFRRVHIFLGKKRRACECVSSHSSGWSLVDVKDFFAAVCRSIHSEDFCEVNWIHEL